MLLVALGPVLTLLEVLKNLVLALRLVWILFWVFLLLFGGLLVQALVVTLDRSNTSLSDDQAWLLDRGPVNIYGL